NAAVDRAVQIDEPALNHKHDHRRLWRVFGDDEGVSLAGRFIDECSRPGDPVVLKVAPVTTERVATHRPDMVVSAQPGAWETLQDDAESPRRDIEVAGL